VADVVGALEGPLGPPERLADGNGGAAQPDSGIREVWQEVLGAARRILESTSIEDLVERQKARESRVMYYI
jgi:DNA-binding IscR family transcriptional regulator